MLVVGLILVATLLLAPIVPMRNVGRTLFTLSPASSEGIALSVAQDNSSISYCYVPYGDTPPPGCAIESDPSGVHYFRDLGNGTWETDLATYESMLQDPYSGFGGTVQIVNDTVYFIGAAQSNITYGGLQLSLVNSVEPAPSGGLGSVTYLLFGVGGLYSDGNYRLIP